MQAQPHHIAQASDSRSLGAALFKLRQNETDNIAVISVPTDDAFMAGRMMSVFACASRTLEEEQPTKVVELLLARRGAPLASAENNHGDVATTTSPSDSSSGKPSTIRWRITGHLVDGPRIAPVPLYGLGPDGTPGSAPPRPDGSPGQPPAAPKPNEAMRLGANTDAKKLTGAIMASMKRYGEAELLFTGPRATANALKVWCVCWRGGGVEAWGPAAG
jgi:hypothetical protein